MSENLADAGIFAQIEREVRAEAEAAVAFALNAPYPAPEEVTKHVYV
jgi:TPP-dependent pyruvate/acetoin dehydrogenase alpha subunit